MTLWRGPGSFTQGFHGPWTSLPEEASGSAASGKGAEKGESLAVCSVARTHLGPSAGRRPQQTQRYFFCCPSTRSIGCVDSILCHGYIIKVIKASGLKVHGSHVPRFPILRKSRKVPQDTAVLVSSVTLRNPQSKPFKGKNRLLLSSAALCLVQGRTTRKRSKRALKKTNTRNHK